MSSDLHRRSLILTGLAALSGCGFAPALGSGGAANAWRGAIKVTAPDTLRGYQMRARLDDHFGPQTTPRYELVLTYSEQQSAATVNTDGDTLRFQRLGTVEWSLSDASGALQTGRAQSFTSYAATGSTVATQAAAADAGARLAIILADKIRDDLYLWAVPSS